MGLSEQIQEELRQGRKPEEIVEGLLRRGISEPTARRFVERAQAAPAGPAPPRARAAAGSTSRRGPRAASPAAAESGDHGRWSMVRGAFLFSLGVLGTAVTYVLARPGGRYVLLYGGIAVGLVLFLQGLLKWWPVRGSRPFPARAVSVAVLVAVVIMAGVLVLVSRQRAQRKADVVQAIREEEGRRGLTASPGTDAPLDPVSAYVVGLRQEDADTRRESAWRLGEMKGRAHDAVPALLAALGDPSPSVRASTGEALLKIDPNNPTVLTAVKGLLRDGSLDVWPRAAAALAGRGDPGAMTFLLGRLDDGEVWPRERAASTLGGLGEKGAAATPALAKKLGNDPDYRVRVACARSLANLDTGTPAVRQALTAALSDGDPRVQAAAKEALSALERR